MAQQIKKKFIKGDAVDGSKIKLLEGQSLRIEVGGQEVELLKLGSNGEVLSKGSEIAFKSQVDAEASARVSGDQSLQSAIDSEVSRAESAEQALDSRIIPMEEILEFEKAVLFEDNAGVVADGQPGVEDSQNRDGWYYQNMAAGQKANWYFFDGVNQANIQQQDFSAYAVVTFDSISSLPILAVYTMPTGTNDVMPGFAHSRYVYSNFSSTPVVGKKYLIHIGDAPSIHPELPRIQVNLTNSQGERLPTERVLTTSFGTNSGAAVGNVKLVVEHLGISSPEYKGNAELRIRPASLSKLQSEETARMEADANLQSQIDALDGNFATDEELASAVSSLEGQINSEMTRAMGVESSLQSEIDAEEARAIAAEQDLQISISNEQTSRQDADLVLDGKIEQEILDRQSAISSEEQARISGDASTLAESKTYTDDKISLVMSNLDTEALDSLVEVVTAFQEADGDLNQAISDLSSSATSALNAEVAAREAADLVLDGKISQEVLDRQSADQSLQSEIDAEEIRAMGEESRIEGKFDGLISTEQSARQLADQDLQSQIDSEESARIAGDQALDAKIDGNFAMYETEVELLRSDINANTLAISSEETARMAADETLQDNIDAEMARAMGEESRIETKFDGMLSSEQSAREAADLVLQSNINAEMTRAMGVESSLQSQITQEVSDRQTAVSTEMSRAMSAEQDLSDRLDVLEADPVTKTYVDGEVSNLQSQINTEKGRVDAILLAADADKDSFAEIVSLINSVDTENDSAFGSYVLSNNAALAQEVSDRQSADQSLQSQIDAEESRAMAAEQQLSSSLSQEVSNRQAAVSAEQSARIAADEALDARVEALETAPVVRIIEDEKQSVSSTLTHVMLDFKAEKIFKVVVGRVNAMKGEDYTVSEEGGKTKLTWIGSFAQGGDEAIVSGDDVFCTYSTFDAESSSGGGSTGGGDISNLFMERNLSSSAPEGWQELLINTPVGTPIDSNLVFSSIGERIYFNQTIDTGYTNERYVRIFFDASLAEVGMVIRTLKGQGPIQGIITLTSQDLSNGYIEYQQNFSRYIILNSNAGGIELYSTPSSGKGFKISKIQLGDLV